MVGRGRSSEDDPLPQLPRALRATDGVWIRRRRDARAHRKVKYLLMCASEQILSSSSGEFDEATETSVHGRLARRRVGAGGKLSEGERRVTEAQLRGLAKRGLEPLQAPVGAEAANGLEL